MSQCMAGGRSGESPIAQRVPRPADLAAIVSTKLAHAPTHDPRVKAPSHAQA